MDKTPRRARTEEAPTYGELILRLETLHGAVETIQDSTAQVLNDISSTLEEIESFYSHVHPSLLGRVAQWWEDRKKIKKKTRLTNFRDISYLNAIELHQQSKQRVDERKTVFGRRKKS